MWKFPWSRSATSQNDAVLLVGKRLIQVAARGNGITCVCAVIINITNEPLVVDFNIGTVFRARGSHQNMALRSLTQIKLSSQQKVEILLPAVCINAERPIPNADNLFDKLSIGDATLTKFLDASAQLMPAAIQAGVWAITNNQTRLDILAKLKTQSKSDGEIFAEFAEHPVIFEADIIEASEVLESIGIRTRL